MSRRTKITIYLIGAGAVAAVLGYLAGYFDRWVIVIIVAVCALGTILLGRKIFGKDWI